MIVDICTHHHTHPDIHTHTHICVSIVIFIVLAEAWKLKIMWAIQIKRKYKKTELVDPIGILVRIVLKWSNRSNAGLQTQISDDLWFLFYFVAAAKPWPRHDLFYFRSQVTSSRLWEIRAGIQQKMEQKLNLKQKRWRNTACHRHIHRPIWSGQSLRWDFLFGLL